MSTKKIVLFGESGAGKSSVVNLMAGREVAGTSTGTEGCTMHWEEYKITRDGCTYKIFDTVGPRDPHLEIKGYLNAVVDTYNLIMRLKNAGGIDLLLFCVPAGRFTTAIQSNYRLLYEWLCEKKVPIVLVLTGLETEQNMEVGWTSRKSTFDKHGIIVDGHACITAVKLEGRHQPLYEQSYRLVWDLVILHTHGEGAYTEDEVWFRRVMQKLRELILSNFKFTQKLMDTNILTRRCGMPPKAAKELVRVKYDLGGK